jgi:hypothetical protein
VRGAGGSPRTVPTMTTATTTGRRLPAALLTAAVAAVIAGCGASGPQRSAGGTIAKAGSISLLSLHVGDCVSDLRGGIQHPDEGHNGIFKVEAVPCAEPHDAQVLRISGLGAGQDGQWPGWSIVDGEAARGRVALQQRLSRVTAPAGASAGGGRLTLFTFRPSQERWEFEGQRKIVFLVLYATPRRGALAAALPRALSGAA